MVEELKTEKPLAIGAFGSSSIKIKEGSDIDMYVLTENKRERNIKREDGMIFEIYHAIAKNLEEGIKSSDIRVIDRMRCSNPLYDPNGIYETLIKDAMNKNIQYPEWIEKTIIGGDYDLIERTNETVNKSIKNNQPLKGASAVRYLVDRIIDIGLRRLNISGHANPNNIPDLVQQLPTKMQYIYEATFKCSSSEDIINIMESIKNENDKLLPE